MPPLYDGRYRSFIAPVARNPIFDPGDTSFEIRATEYPAIGSITKGAPRFPETSFCTATSSSVTAETIPYVNPSSVLPVSFAAPRIVVSRGFSS